MKNKFLLFFTTLLLAVTQLWGQSETLDCPLGTIENNAMTFVTDNFTIIHAKGESNNFAAYSPWRVYTDNTVTFTGGENVQNITSVVITATNASYAQVANDSDFTVLSGTGTFSSSVSGNIVTINITGEDVTSIQIKPNAQTRWESITLNFQEAETSTTYNLTVTQPTGGSISPEGVIEVEEGGSAEFTATASECYTFNHWLIDGANAGNTNPYVFTNVTEDHTITAVFDTVAPYAITATAGTNGSISPNGETLVGCGSLITFTITPNAGFEIADVLVDGVSVGAVATYTFDEVMANHTIEVSFEEIIVEPSEPCFEEGFDNLTEIATGTQYGAGTYTNNEITWNFHGQSPIGAGGDAADYSIEGQGILLRRASDSFLETTVPAGVETFSFEYRKAYTGGAERQLEFMVNGTQVAVTPAFGSGSGDNTTVYTFSYDLNTTAPTLVKIKLTGEESTNRHATIDNISWTCDTVQPCDIPAPTAENQTLCDGSTVAELVAEGTEIKWYATEDATEALDATEVLVAGSYFASQTVDGCESERTEVIVTILEAPAAPLADSPQIFTEGQTLADLVVEGENLTWYDADGNELAETTVLVDGTTYFVSQTIGECESESTAITVVLSEETEVPCFLETFNELTDIVTGSNYGAGTYTHNGITWNFHGQSPLATSQGDFAIDGQGILLRRASDSFLETTVPAGIENFSFQYRKAYIGGNARQLELLVNGNVVATTPEFGAGSGEDATVYTFNYVMNSEEPVTVKIKLTGDTTTNRHVTVDNISWNCEVIEPCENTITATAGEGGAITPSGDVVVECGANQTFEILADAGFEIADVLVDGESVGVVEAYTFENVNEAHTIEVSFVEVACNNIITATSGANGTITPSGEVLVECGENQTFEILANPGFEIEDVLVDGASVGAVSTYTFEEVNEDHTIEVTFKEIETEGPCFLETFNELSEIATGTTYGAGSYTNNGVTWNFHGQSPLATSQGDFAIDGQGILLRRASDGYLEGNLPAGVGVFSFQYRKAYTGGAARQLEFIVDGEIVATTEVFGEGSGEQTTVYTFSHEINSEEPVVVRIKLSGEESTNRHATIDNISWTCVEVEPCDLPAPTAESPQQFTAGQTLADLVVQGENLTWYDADGNELPETTLLVDGATYYVTSSNDVCESEATSIEVYLEDLGNGAINFANFNYYPNPVKNKLNIINANEITEVSIYNLAGALVAKQIASSKSVEINLTSISTGTYIVKVISGKETKSFKIIKK